MTRSYDIQVREFLFDLRNSALEHSFKPGEKWEVSLVSELDKIAAEKKYNPVVFAQPVPESLKATLSLVRARLQLPQILEVNDVLDRHQNLEYIIAYNAERER